MKEIISHRCGLDEINNLIRIEPADDPGPGGAPTKYQFFLNTPGGWHPKGRVEFHASLLYTKDERGNQVQINQMGGVTNEALLAVVLDRLQGFQKGKFACNENEHAITHIQETLNWLFARTRDRINRGVNHQYKA